jgi:hypothetical protein
MKNNLIAISAIASLTFFASCETQTNPKENSEPTIQEASTQPEKSDLENTIEDVNLIQDKLKELGNDNKKSEARKDSIWEAEREEEWVYQLSDPTTEKETLLEPYKLLENVLNIKAFKQGKTYFLYKNDHSTKSVLEDSLEAYQSKFNTVNLHLEVVDLMSKCERNQRLVQTDNIKIKVKKESVSIPCYKCIN